ncbi:MAG: (Fe-S)-binding protein [Chromatiaceae bacterium]|nr:MAG: (Fe-S)-binding protein [Chromatiaceae bacterium]
MAAERPPAAPGPPPGLAPTPADLLALADQCVKCGYCLPHCPTFRAAHDEAESPRGRIALIQGWLAGPLGQGASGRPGPRTAAHLAHCLECLACEPVCPSLVQFGTLMDGARALQMARRPAWQRGWWRLRLGLLTQPRWLPLLATAAGLYRRLGLSALVRRWGRERWPRLLALDRLTPALGPPRLLAATAATPPAAAAAAPAAGRPRQVLLFRGCIARAVQQPAEAAALQVLARFGWAVAIPPAQGCCGAMHRHNGLPATANALVQANARALTGATSVGLASACVGELRRHGGIDALELCQFLGQTDWPADLTLAPLARTIAVHEPCSQRNLLRDSDAVYRLLARIPAARVLPLPDNAFCCGAAGTYLLEQPQRAAALVAAKVTALRALRPDLLVTTNTGCALHLAAAIRAAGLDCPVLHPVEVIARALPSAPRL